MDDNFKEFVDNAVDERLSCPICQRKFNHDVLIRHKGICEKSMKKRRKPFSSQNQRSVGSDVPRQTKKNQEPEKTPKNNNWRAKHEVFLASIRAARGPPTTGQGGGGGGGGGTSVPPARVVNPDYVQCPHCERRFNEHSAPRHIEFCKEQKSRIAPKKAGGQDLTKLAKRTQYKPPPLGKKRTVTNSDSPSGSANKTQRQVLTPKYGNSGYVPSLFEKDSKMSSKVHKDSDYGDPLQETNNSNKRSAIRRTQSTNIANGRKEGVSRRHSSNVATSCHKDSRIGSPSPKHKLTNAVSPLSRADSTNGDIFHDDDFSRAASGSRRNKSLQKPSTVFRDDFDDHNSTSSLHKKLDPRISDLTGGLHDSSGSGDDSDGHRPSGSGRRKGSRHDGASSGVSRKESGISVGSIREGSGTRLSKFCCECGTKYPVPHAKYCCECGVKRLYVDI